MGLSTPWQVMQYDGVTEAAEKRGFIVVAPSGYSKLGFYGLFKGSSMDGNWNSELDRFGRCSEQDVLNVLAIVRKEFTIDDARIYLMVHSMGGAGTLYLGAKYPNLWA